jgi:geranylgeranyl diphosphate synthase, type II
MDVGARIEQSLVRAIDQADGRHSPPRLAAAMRHAVFPRGARIRPRLCLAVAAACDEDDFQLSDAAAASIEFLHCASLVHDDLPCFDDAATRRGRPSVHNAFGERLAVLAGDALIVLAFDTLAQVSCASQRLRPVILTVTRAVGVPTGIVAGQAWECESAADLSLYHRQKTGSLFSAATVAGAAAAGAEPEPWRLVGEKIGEAYQVADDLRDAIADPDEIGKPTGRDLALGRPSAITAFGVEGAVKRLETLVAEAIEAIPACPRAGDLRALIMLEAKRLMPKKFAQRAA